MVISAIALVYVSFLLIHLVHNSVLVYASEAFVFAAGIFGVTLYFRNQMGEFKSEIWKYIDNKKEEDAADTKKNSKKK